MPILNERLDQIIIFKNSSTLKARLACNKFNTLPVIKLANSVFK